MGTRNIIMPLLSTLAALIIIVNSLDEEMGRDTSSHEVDPNFSESGPINHGQTWRAAEIQPIIQQSSGEEWDQMGPQEQATRRRPGRKRKRRPHMSSQDESIQHERKGFYEDNDSDVELPNVSETTELPRRRLKRPEIRNNQWVENYGGSRRQRRRGQRRKRPIDPEYQNTDDSTVHKVEKHLEIENGDRVNDDKWIYRHKNEDYNTNERNEEQRNVKDEDSTSETSDEINISIYNDYNEKSKNNYSLNYHQEQTPLDAASLKELLKKSDGSSLSEILQQRNLSLADLLNGNEHAISALAVNEPRKNFHKREENKHSQESADTPIEFYNVGESEIIRIPSTEETTMVPLLINTTTVEPLKNNSKDVIESKDIDNVEDIINTETNNPKMFNRRRIQPSGRRRQRIKSSLYSNITRIGHRNVNNFRLPKRRIVQIGRNDSNENEQVNVNELSISNNGSVPFNPQNEESLAKTTVVIIPENNDKNKHNYSGNVQQITDSTPLPKILNTQTLTSLPTKEEFHIELAADIEDIVTETTVLVTTSMAPKSVVTNSEIRRQSLTNRLKKKRLKQKNSTLDSQEIGVKDLFGMANLVSASEFIAKIQSLDTTETTISPRENNDNLTTLEDVTVKSTTSEIKAKTKLPVAINVYTTTPKLLLNTSTEESAKKEIEEIFHDTQTSARLSKILLERNMTINELVEHRERGSSQVHLADIFHNTSREPNPPEPFLSKSLLEPISKKTYPLRALLEANVHDAAIKTKATENVNIPLAMDFGNNVNENSENLGIVSLLNKFVESIDADKKKIKTDSEGTPYFTSVTTLNETYETTQSPDLLKNNNLANLDDLFVVIKRNYQNKSIPDPDSLEIETNLFLTNETDNINEDLDGGGLIVLEDLQHLNDFENNIAQMSNDKLEVKLYDEIDTSTTNVGILEKIPNNTKSVTIATAAIIGLTMMLFLLTYIGFKWRNRRQVLRRESFSGERIPTPVFENRKKSKNNCSNRSISPMLSSNIYTLSTLDSRTGKESPEYTWDSLRKPFQ